MFTRGKIPTWVVKRGKGICSKGAYFQKLKVLAARLLNNVESYYTRYLQKLEEVIDLC